MANLTRSERHNRMLDNTFGNYRKHQESLPPCMLYGRYLKIAVEKLGITEQEARSKYGKCMDTQLKNQQQPLIYPHQFGHQR